jgi:serine-type D-Ala-D-Ala carboxypeptidase/endopeptidase
MKPLVCFLLVLILYCVARPLRASDTEAEYPEVRALLRQRLRALGKQVGIVVGIIDGKGRVVISEGSTGLDADKPVDGDTIFEIGSITKIFTSLLLADMVEHGEVKLDEPLSNFLPLSVKVPKRNGKEITLVDLATHTSGLPRLPDHTPKDPNNPYADYTVEQMYAFLSDYTLPRDIGSEYEYSNFGAGLLGHVLALKAGMAYESLVMQRICKPLGMNDTCVTITPEMNGRFAAGHDETGKTAEHWDVPTLAGCGALRSTANDLLKFLAASMGIEKSALAPAMKFQQIPRHDTNLPANQIALGWHIMKLSDTEFVWHNGGSGGFCSFIGFDEQQQRGVVVLINAAIDVDDIGLRLLRKPPRKHVAIALDPKIYDAYVGIYQLPSGHEFTVRRDKERILVQLTGQSFMEVFPESETDFFYKTVNAQLSFEKNDAGTVSSLTLHQNGLNQTAIKEK